VRPAIPLAASAITPRARTSAGPVRTSGRPRGRLCGRQASGFAQHGLAAQPILLGGFDTENLDEDLLALL